MNFNDYVVSLNKKNEELKKLSSIINNVEMILKMHENWVKTAFTSSYMKKINSAFNNSYQGEANNLSNFTIQHFDNLRQKLIEIDFLEFGEILTKFRNVNTYNSKSYINGIYDQFITSYKTIHNYVKLVDPNERSDKYNQLINAINDMKNAFEKFNCIYMYVNEINDNLIQNNGDEYVELRLLNENNTVSSLIENMQLIQGIYNNINELTGGTEELKYSRIESGSLITFLMGCVGTLVTIVPLLNFGYKVYSEQFSPNAKLEKELKEIKVRGEYLKLIKEHNEIKTINEGDVQRILSGIEEGIKKLYSKNPYIKLNGNELGLKELRNIQIDIKQIKSTEENQEDNSSLLSEQ